MRSCYTLNLMDALTQRETLTELHAWIEQINPRCHWGNPCIVDADTERAREQYRALIRRAAQIEQDLGW